MINHYLLNWFALERSAILRAEARRSARAAAARMARGEGSGGRGGQAAQAYRYRMPATLLKVAGPGSGDRIARAVTITASPCPRAVAQAGEC